MNWTEIISGLFNLVIIPLLIAASGYLISYIRLKKQELLNKTENETYKKYIEMLDKTITDCVTATTQTYVDSLKKQNKFDEEAQKVAFKQTYEAIMSILTEDAKEYLTESVNDLDIYIKNKIESKVGLTKTSK